MDEQTTEYSAEQEREEQIARAELGRKYKAANEVLDEVINEQRENVIRQLESADFGQDSDAIGLVLYLRVIKIFHDMIKAKIDLGEIAEKELSEDGD